MSEYGTGTEHLGVAGKDFQFRARRVVASPIGMLGRVSTEYHVG